MKEFNLGDLAQVVHDTLEGAPVESAKDIQTVLETAFTKMNEICVDQVNAGAKVGRFEQNFGPYPFTLRLKKVAASEKGGFGGSGVPARYGINVRVGKGYPKPQK